jgi:hypothetical protein
MKASTKSRNKTIYCQSWVTGINIFWPGTCMSVDPAAAKERLLRDSRSRFTFDKNAVEPMPAMTGYNESIIAFFNNIQRSRELVETYNLIDQMHLYYESGK